MKNQSLKIKSLLVALVIILPSFAQAATISAKIEGNLQASANNIVDIVLDTEGKNINVVEGSAVLNLNTKNIVTLSTGGSALTLWPNKPSLNGNTISFTGGTPNGISGKDLILFKIILNPEFIQNLTISFKDSFGYLNDGKATKIQLSSINQSFKVNTNANTSNKLADLIRSDKTPPEPFTIEIGRDNSIFDGKYFISFNAIDNESGINRYEIIEGDNPSIRSGSPYVLRDQTLKERVEVRAIDNAGNVRIEILNGVTGGLAPLSRIILGFIVLIFAYLYFKRLQK